MGCRATLYSQIVIPHPSLFVDAISRRSRPFRPRFARSSLRISRASELQSERRHDRVQAPRTCLRHDRLKRTPPDPQQGFQSSGDGPLFSRKRIGDLRLAGRGRVANLPAGRTRSDPRIASDLFEAWPFLILTADRHLDRELAGPITVGDGSDAVELVVDPAPNGVGRAGVCRVVHPHAFAALYRWDRAAERSLNRLVGADLKRLGRLSILHHFNAPELVSPCAGERDVLWSEVRFRTRDRCVLRRGASVLALYVVRSFETAGLRI